MKVGSYVAFLLFSLWLLFSPARAKNVEAIQVSATPDYIETAVFSYTQTAVMSVTPSITPTLTLLPSATPTVTVTPLPLVTFDPSQNLNVTELQIFHLSFYDPHIGYYFPEIADVNCLEFDYDLRDCVSNVHHGMDEYRMWLGKGAACPDDLAYDTVFYVHNPTQLAGYWRCIDVGDLDRNGLRYIDFMLSYPEMIWTGENLNDFPWSSEVQIEVISVP